MSIQERLISNAMRMTWFMMIVSSIVILSGVAFCYLGVTGEKSTLKFLGLELNSETIGLMVIAFGVLIFYSQRKFFSHLVAPENIVTLFSSIRDTASEFSTQTKTNVQDSFKSKENEVQKENRKEFIRSEEDLRRRFIVLLTMLGISVCSLCIGLYLVMFGTQELEKVGVALISVTVGYWLR